MDTQGVNYQNADGSQRFPVWRANCYGCNFKYSTVFIEQLSMIMGSHTFNCEGAKAVLREAFTEDTVAWKFNEYCWYFKWTPPDPILYIFSNRQSNYAMCAIPMKLDGEEPTKEIAQACSREWITEHHNGYSFETISGKQKGPVVQTPPPDDGTPRCDMCFKSDEGDLVPSPNDMLKQRCMECLIGSSR
jgi:hypothetical protein